MGVFFWYAILIGRLAMSFQNWVIASRPETCRRAHVESLEAEGQFDLEL